MQSQGLTEPPGDQAAEREPRHLLLRGHLLKRPRCPRAAAGASYLPMAARPYILSVSVSLLQEA